MECKEMKSGSLVIWSVDIEVHARKFILIAVTLNKLSIQFISRLVSHVLNVLLCIQIFHKEVVGDSENLSKEVLSMGSGGKLIHKQDMISWLLECNTVSC